MNEWISVKDRMPKKGGLYLVLYGERDWPYSYCVQIRRFFEDDSNGITWRKVTHWMPLPEPPKEEKRNDESR